MRPVIVTAALAATLMAFGACGSDDTPDTPEARAAQLAEELGCASCHGPQGQGGFGPPLAGLVGSTAAGPLQALGNGLAMVPHVGALMKMMTFPFRFPFLCLNPL